jgi:putative intracellular protease/amidase
MSASNGTPKPLRVGVLYEETQMTDLAGLDILGNLTPKTIGMVAQMVPSFEPLMALAIPMEFLYISSSLEPAWTTPEMFVKPTHTYENAPRDLDILLLGGPNPMDVKDASLKFLREASKQTKVILTTCTGAMWLAKAGVLDGKKATTNRVMLEPSKKMFPKVEWLDQRWVEEKGDSEGAQIWTSGGAGCGECFCDAHGCDSANDDAGIDMFIEYTDRTFNKQLVKLGCMGLDFNYEGRSQFYKGPIPSMG